MTLCSNCSEPVRPVVAIDIDGTLANYHGHFLLFAEEWIGRETTDPASYDGSEPYRDWFCRSFGVDVTTFRNVKLAYRQGGLKRTQPPFAGARDLARGVREAGAELWLTTTRPHDRFDRVDPDTREWLRRQGIPFDGLLYSDDKIGALAERVSPERVVAVIDDLPVILEQVMADHGWFPLLRRTVYNKGSAWTGAAVYNLADALSVTTNRITEWSKERS